MSMLPPNGDEEPEITDPVILSVLANRGRSAVVLTSDQERLLDEWMDGRLAPPAAETAATLTRENTLAAEHVLERRLLQAATQGADVPQALTARVLAAVAQPPAPAPSGWWRRLGTWHWTAIAGAAALASIVAVVGVPVWQKAQQDSGAIQVAMVTIGDRNALFEPSDIRMRGPTPPPGPVVEQRFRDVEVPASILKGLLAAATAPRSSASREIEPYLSMSGDRRPSQIVIDATLKARIEASSGDARLPVRIYDLEDPRSADLRPLIGAAPQGRRLYLLTIKP